DAHHEGVEHVLRAHQPGVEEPQRRRHQQHQRSRDQHPGGIAGVAPAAHLLTGVTAPSSLSPVRIRTAWSSGTTKILPSPTSPVRPPSQSACTVLSTKSSETATSNLVFSERPICTVVPR